MNKIILVLLVTISLHGQEKIAVFGGGCFWCIEAAFQPLKGVLSAESGYMGADVSSANYEDVSKGTSGHFEVVQIKYDSTVISYEELLRVFWKNIDPTDSGGQFADRGAQYKTVIFYYDESQRRIAQASKERLDTSKIFSEDIVTQIKPASEFYPAEEYHQDYFKKNSLHYQMYKRGSGREAYIKKQSKKLK